jgi:acyl carrier protein
MPKVNHLEDEVAEMIVETLNLDIDPAEIDPRAPLFRDGLGLDSIDALELALALSQRYGFKLRADDPNNTRIFSSLRALTEYVRTNRAK